MAKLFTTPDWRGFMANVEGRAASAVQVVDGVPMGSLADAADHLNPKLLADVIRGGAELPAEVRSWLADMIHPDVNIAMRLTLGRRDGGRPRSPVGKHWGEAESYLDLIDQGHTKQQALGKVMDSSRLSRNTVLTAVADFEAARLAHQQAIEGED